ncbi:hypothetical protein FJZ53_02565 [Candidatus Woesearchaeota archaeon]|nr:hypothetical protein [Candidatus Woesearchaeota archaeon]
MTQDKEKTLSYLPVSATKAQTKLSEGRKELTEALEYMNQIKVSVAQWQNDTKDFFDEVKDVYETKKEDIEKKSHLPVIASIKAAWETLPSLFSREDPTKKRFGRVLSTLVRDADHIYKSLDGELNTYEERFEEVDTLTGDLIRDAKVYRQGIEDFNTQKKDLETQLTGLETKLKEMTDKNEAYLELKEEILNMKRALEGVRKERSSALNKYQQTMNILDALEGFRDENQILLSEGRNLYETLETNINSLRPLFDNITASADLVEFQRKALDTYDMLKKTFNPAMIAITAVAKGVSKVAAEKQGEKFIESETIEVVKQIVHKHKEEIAQRVEQEDKLIEDILGKKDEKEDVSEMEQDENGAYKIKEEEKK